MKRSSFVLGALLLLCALFVMAPALLRAQMQNATPAQMAAAKVQRLALPLGLSSAQQESALTIFTAEETAEAPIRKSEQEAHLVLETAVKSGNTATITQVSAMLGELSGQSTLAKSVADAQFWALLSSDQQARYTQMQAQQGQMGGGMGGGMGRGGPPPPR